MTLSRGNAISAYSPDFSKGAQVYGANIASGAITSAHIADGTIVAADVAAGSITSAKIGTGAVVEVKIGAGAVTSAKMGAQAITSAKIRAAFLSGTLVSGKVTIAVAHGLGVKPKLVVVCPIATLAQVSGASATSGIGKNVPVVSLAAASAATSTNIYLIGGQTQNTAIKYAAYVQL